MFLSLIQKQKALGEFFYFIWDYYVLVIIRIVTKVYKTLVEEPAWKTPLRSSRNRWYGSIMMDV